MVSRKYSASSQISLTKRLITPDMKRVLTRLTTLQEKNPGWSSLVCLYTAVRGTRTPKTVLKVLLKKHVDKEDYQSVPSSIIIDDLDRVSREGN